MKRIYLDNAATSFPKAPGLGRTIASYIENDVVNSDRTQSVYAENNFDFLYSLRNNLCRLFNFHEPECIGFTQNDTEALNWILKGLLRRGDHVIATDQEHNSVIRPLNQMGVDWSRFASPLEIDSLVRENTRALVVNVAGNVSGRIVDLEAIAEKARKHSLLLILDTAQATPFVSIDFEALGVAALAFAGHKFLLGPEGTGGFLLRRDLAVAMEPLIAGGTGSHSDLLTMPDTLPDKFSVGTQNLIGLRGLAHSLSYVLDNLSSLKAQTEKMTLFLLHGLEALDGLRIVGPGVGEKRTDVISVTCLEKDNADLAAFLSSRGIETRVGLHCSPEAHKSLGTYPTGTLRFSPGPFTTVDEVVTTLEAVKEFLES